jgi:AraC-like DNA-binding protein
MLIESGSHVPGVDPADFRLLPYTALRYEIPHPRLAPFVADYHVFDSIVPEGGQRGAWMLPNAPAVRLILADHPMAVARGTAEPEALPRASFYGATSRATELLHGGGGVTVGFSLTAAGFARMCRADAAELRDRVVPLEELVDPSWIAVLMARLSASDCGPAVKAIFDAALLPLMSEPHPMEADIQRIAALLLKPGVASLRDESAALGIAPRRLERLTKRFFGFPPKLLLRRARFLRSIIALKLAGEPYDYSVIDPAYHDQPHFIRDAHRFLGMSPSRFLKIPTPYLDSVLRARAIVHGASVAALDDAAKGRS